MNLPIYTSLQGYNRQWLRNDIIAGLTVWAVLVPEALAYASIAGVSPVVGLYAAPPALIFYAAFGSSRHLVVGPMSATAALSAATIADLVVGDAGAYAVMTAALAITVGVLAITAGLMRLGFLSNFISEPVLKGFIIGLALTIIAGQLPKLFGVEKASGNFFEQIWGLLKNLDDTSSRTLAVGGLSLALLLALRRFVPRVPGSLVAVALGIILVKVFSLDEHGVAIVGQIDSGLPSFGRPDVDLSNYDELLAPAIGVMLVGFAEGLGAAKTYAAREHYEIDANRELLGLGAANIGSGFSSGMVVNGSLSKTAVNGSSGAKSQVSGLVVAALTVVTLLLLTGLFEDLPEATLAAIVIAAVIELVEIPALQELYRVSYGRARGIAQVAARPDFVAAIAAMFGVLIFDTLPGLFIGIAVSMLLLLYRASTPHIATLGRQPGTQNRYEDLERHPEDEVDPHIVVLRVESGIFFANAEAVRTHIKHAASADGVRAVVLDAETVPVIDITASRMLVQLAEDLERDGIRLVLARGVGTVRDVLRETEGGSALGDAYPSVAAAVAALTEGRRAHD